MVEPAYLNIITRKISFTYRNWRGEIGTRVAEPVGLWFGATEWHPQQQWFLRATDVEKDVIRDFAVRDMTEVKYV
jgi:predicted DNA-binding transcriptional regulator YafY